MPHLTVRGLFVILITGVCGAQTTWTGVVSADWSVAGNWSAGVPTASVDAVIPAGTPSSPSTAGVAAAACRDLVLNLGATLTTDPVFPLAVNRGATVSGVVAGTGLLRFVGASGGLVSATGTIGPSVEIAKSGGANLIVAGSWNVSGNLTLTSGVFLVANAAAYTISVAGSATFSAGTLGVSVTTGVIDVAGNVTFSGTSIVGAMPTIRCAGTWMSDAVFAPTSGSVVLDGVGAQAILGNGTLPALTIAATSSATRAGALTLAGGLTVNGSLTHSGGTLAINGTTTVNGTLSMPSSTLDANANFTVSVTGSVDLGGGTHTFAASYTGTGSVTATGLFVFDSANGASVSSAAPFPAVQISKFNGVSLLVNSSWTVNGSLTHTSGGFLVAQSAANTISVSGSATFSGGTLGVSVTTGVIDVAGNVTFSGTSIVGAMPTIRCAGTWTSDAAFAPMTGSVVLDGAGAQAIVGNGTLPSLTIAATSAANRTGALTLAGALTLNGSLAHSGGTFVINGNATINGTLSMPSSTLDANGAFTVAAAGSVDLGGGTHTFGGNWTGSGSVTATGLFVFDSGTGGSVLGTAPMPSVQISKSAGVTLLVNSSLTVNGNLALTSGSFLVAQAPTYVVAVSGHATFSGGALGVPTAGTIDAAGNVTFSGTTTSSLAPTIRCGGNWTSDAAYAPANGIVVMDGTGAQAIAAAASFATLTINAGSATTSAGPLTVGGTLTVNGSLAIPTASLDANGNFVVSATGSVDLGIGTHTFAQNYTVNGSLTASGTFVFDSINTATGISVPPFPSIVIAKLSAAPLIVGSAWTVSGSLTVTSGGLSVSAAPGFTVSVLGNAAFSGGALGAPVTGTIDVTGDVTFSGTTVGTIMPTIRCAGNWVSDGAFTPGSGIVELDGIADTTFTGTTGTWAVPTLKIKNGVRRPPPGGLTIAATTITIEGGGSLVLDGGDTLVVHRPAEATAVDIQGGLHVATNAELALGPQASATVAATGLLELVGTVDFPARVAGAAGGGYGLTVNGTIAAKNFLVKEMGAAGLVINTSATFAPPPNDLRGGTFDFRAGAPAGSVLLDVRRAAATDIRYARFLNTPGAAGVFNVKTVASSAPIGLTNWTGPFAGAAFESDANNLIAWNPPQQTALSFSALPGAELSEITWSVAALIDYARFSLRRGTSPGGPFTEIFTSPIVLVNYGWVDQPLVANQTYYYELHQQLTHDPWILLATGTTTPYSAGPPANVYKVGGGGPFATIQAAINAATSADSIVWVTPGTYAPFTIGASAPSNLRILGDGTGPISVTTSSGPVQILNVPASSGIELGNLAIGSAATAQSAIVISNCSCAVVLDELVVASAPTHAAVSVSGSSGVAIQRSAVAGGPGVSASSSSYVAISRGSLSSLVSTASTIEIAGVVPGSVNVTPPGSLIAHAGVMLDVDVPEFSHLSFPTTLTFDGFPSSLLTLVVSTQFAFLSFPGGIEMPILIDPAGATILPPLPTDASGHFQVTFELPPVAALLGSTYIFQAANVNPVTGLYRVSNVATMVAMP